MGYYFGPVKHYNGLNKHLHSVLQLNVYDSLQEWGEIQVRVFMHVGVWEKQ